MSAGVAAVQARIASIQARFGATLAVGVAAAPGRAPATAFQSALTRALATADAGAAQPANLDPPRGVVTGGDVVAAARRYLGVPYRWGGTDPRTGLDCSGFVQRVYRDLGIDLPRVSRDQARAGRPVASLAEARPGDLVAFGSPVDHIGIYVGDGKMIVAPRSGEVVRVQEVYRTPTAIRRIIPDAPEAAAPATYDSLFAAAGARHGVDPALLRAVAWVESRFDPAAVSPAGARGLMQLMPDTAAALGVDPLDPAQAVDGAARLLAGHLRRFGSVELALAAYNAGGGAVARAGGVPPYPETQAYVRRVLAELEGGRP